MKPQNFNDFLCLFIMGFIFLLWLLDGLAVIVLNREVLGASIAFFTIIGQFYYRRAPTAATTSPETTTTTVTTDTTTTPEVK